MNRRLLIPAVVTLTLLAGACSSTDNTATPTPSASSSQALKGTQWVLSQYSDGTTDLKPVPAGIQATAAFTATQISGTTGCNNFSGPYQTVDGTITIGDLATTLIGCQGETGQLEAAYLKALGLAKLYKVSADTLTLSTDKDAPLLSFTTQKKNPLVGTAWTATSINNGNNGVEPTVEGVSVTLTLADDGTASGSAGCNTYSGSYTVKGSALTFGPLVSTKKACDGEVGRQETAYLAALAEVSKYVIRGTDLELRDSKGALQAAYSTRQ